MQIKLVLLTICTFLFAVGSAAPDPAHAPFVRPLVSIRNKIAPKITRPKDLPRAIKA